MKKLKNFVKRFFKRTKKILNSKLTVAAVILAIVGVGASPAVSKTFASDEVDTAQYYDFGTVYQQFMLANGNKLKDQTKNSGFGLIGSGGVSGTFSYTAIEAQGADLGKQQAADATKFSQVMGTYSFYNYFSYSPHGFDAIFSIFLRLTFGIVLALGGVILDLVNFMMQFITSLLLNLNIIPLLSSAFVQSDLGDKMLASLHITKDVFQTIMNYAMLSMIAIILILIFMVLRRGSRNIDRGKYTDLKNRIITLVFLPLTMVAAAYLFQDVSQMTNDSQKTGQSAFATYLIDVQNWAYRTNFSPDGAQRDSTGEVGKVSKYMDGYVDMSYNPYQDGQGNGTNFIKQVNSTSDLTRGNQLFANSSLALDYLNGDTFTAREYLDYESTKLGGSVANDNSSYGGYYEYSHGSGSNDSRDIITDVKGVISNNTADLNGNFKHIDGDKDGGSTGFSKAISDYVTSDTLGNGKGDRVYVASGVTAWQDRFVYGAKKTGASMDDYYKVGPSNEQVVNNVGEGKQGYSLSTESTFLALNTTFDRSGGHYYLDAPARGIMATAAVFDSSQSDNYRISMVGLAGFTVPALLTSVILHLIVFIAVFLVVLSIGVVEMNVGPFKAWFKALFTGKIQYLQSFAIQTAGVVGTYLFLFLMPDIVEAILTMVIDLVNELFSKMIGQGGNATVDLMQAGMGKLAGFGVAVMFAISILHFPQVSKAFLAMMSFPWDWAKSASEKLEMDADSRSARLARGKGEARMKKFDNFVAGAAGAAISGSKGLSDSFNSMRDRFQSGGENFQDRFGSVLNGDTKLRDPKKATITDRLKNGLTPKNLIRGLNPAGMEETSQVLGVGSQAATGAAGVGMQDSKAHASRLPELSGAEDTLYDLENADNLKDRTKDSVQEARLAKDDFSNSPTPESKKRLQEALAKLNEDIQDDPNADTNYRHKDLLLQASQALEGYTPQADVPMTRDGQVDKDSPEAQKMLQDVVRDAEIARVLGNNMGENPLDPKAKQRLRTARQRVNNVKGQFALDPSRENYEKLQAAQDNLQTEMGNGDSLSQADKDRIIRQYGAGDSRFLNRQLNNPDTQQTPQTVDDVSDITEKIAKQRNLPQDQRNKMEDLQAAIQNYKQDGNTTNKAALVDAIAQANPTLEKQGAEPVDISQLRTAPKKISSLDDVASALATTLKKPDLSAHDNALLKSAQDAVDTYDFDGTEASKRAMVEAVKNARPVLEQASTQPLNLTASAATSASTAGLEQALIQTRGSRQTTDDDQARLAEATKALDAYKSNASEANKLALAKALGNAQPAAQKATGRALDLSALTVKPADSSFDASAINSALAGAATKTTDSQDKQTLANVQTALDNYQKNASNATQTALAQAIAKANPVVQKSGTAPIDLAKVMPRPTANADQTAITNALVGAMASPKVTSSDDKAVLNQVEKAMQQYQKDTSSANKLALAHAISKANPVVQKSGNKPIDLSKINLGKPVVNANSFDGLTDQMVKAMGNTQNLQSNEKATLNQVNRAMNAYQKQSNAQTKQALAQAIQHANPVIKKSGGSPIDLSKMSFATDKSKSLINSGLGNIKNENLQKAVQNLQSSNAGNYKENQAQFEQALKNLAREERGQIRRSDLKDGIAGLQRELEPTTNPEQSDKK